MWGEFLEFALDEAIIGQQVKLDVGPPVVPAPRLSTICARERHGPSHYD